LAKLSEKVTNCSYQCPYNVLDNTAQNSSDNLLSYPPGNHHSSDVV